MIGKQLNIPKTIILRILCEDMKKRKICACFVPHVLTREQKGTRLAQSENLLEMDNTCENFLEKIITGDESWCYTCDSERSDIVQSGLEFHPPNWKNYGSKNSG